MAHGWSCASTCRVHHRQICLSVLYGWCMDMHHSGVNDTGVGLTNASAGGQGTYYYSSVWDLYVWIGQAGISVAPDFVITTAPAREGPWATPVKFYSADYISWSYTLQAHPGLLANSSENAIYLSYVVYDSGLYWTPLIYVQWESLNKDALIAWLPVRSMLTMMVFA
ncbi:hypothetical protein DPV78_012816 [Talaromyces pinophilus]|nr:hypothetical protein DPV78_012816 [Talaromyces pinophilus]